MAPRITASKPCLLLLYTKPVNCAYSMHAICNQPPSNLPKRRFFLPSQPRCAGQGVFGLLLIYCYSGIVEYHSTMLPSNFICFSFWFRKTFQYDAFHHVQYIEAATVEYGL